MMKVGINVWEYDVKQAGKTFLESKGYKLSDKKEEYVIQIGNIFKSDKSLYDEFITEMRQLLINNLSSEVNVLRFYVDEIVVDRPIELKSDKYAIRNKKVLLYIEEKHNKFIKVYETLEHKIAKTFALQAVDVFKDVAVLIKLGLNKQTIQYEMYKIVNNFIYQRYDIQNYIVTKHNQKWIISEEIEVIYHENIDNTIPIDKRFYFHLLTKYLREVVRLL